MSTITLSDKSLSKLALYGKVLGDETRLRILWILLDGEKCVGDLAKYLNVTHSAVSHQLHELRLAGMVRNRRDGKQIFYSYKNDCIREQFMRFSTNIV